MNLSLDPEWRSAISRFEQNVEAQQEELAAAEVEIPQREAEFAEFLASAKETEPIDLAHDTELRELESKHAAEEASIFGRVLETIGVETTHAEGGVHWKGLAEEALEEAAEKAVEHTAHKLGRVGIKPPPLPHKAREWFYVRGDEPVGPVSESELLELLRSAEVKWSALVWHEGLPEWIQASTTELREKAGAAKPPPLPKTVEGKAGAKKAATCAQCGTENTPGDKFCSNCGAPLTRSRK